MKLSFVVAEATRKEHFAESGEVLEAKMEVEVDPTALTKEQRAALVGSGDLCDRYDLRVPNDHGRINPWEVTDATLSLNPEPATVVDTWWAAWEAAAAAAEAERQAECSAYASGERPWPTYHSRGGPHIGFTPDKFREEFAGCPTLDAALERLEADLTAECAAAAEQAASEAALNERVASEKARREAERDAWVAAHGSTRLRKALAGGYPCQRLYVVERAEQELPGYTVDFRDVAAWEERANPTESALDEADRVKAAGLDISEAVVRWLTVSPSNLGEDDGYEDEWFEPTEAVVVRGYLGKYDAIKPF